MIREIDTDKYIVIAYEDLPTFDDDPDDFVKMDTPPGFAKIRSGLAVYYHRMALVYLARSVKAAELQEQDIDRAREIVIAEMTEGTLPPKYDTLPPFTQRAVDELAKKHIEAVRWKREHRGYKASRRS